MTFSVIYLFVYIEFNVPVNNLSVMSERDNCFLGFKKYNTVPPMLIELRTSRSPMLFFHTTALRNLRVCILVVNNLDSALTTSSFVLL